MEPDLEKYMHHLDDSDLTKEQKREYLQTLWNIMSEFVALGFGEHPVQLACGKDQKTAPETILTALDAVGYTDNYLAGQFEDAADIDQGPAAEGMEPCND